MATLAIITCVVLSLYVIFPLVLANPAFDIALCVATTDDNRDIAEWVEYHKRLGVGGIYVIDEVSEVAQSRQLLPYIKTGLVTYEYYSERKIEEQKLLRPYTHWHHLCIARFGPVHKWMGFLTVDEFLVVNETLHLARVLEAYENDRIGGVLLNVRRFTTSGHKKRPKGGILENYHQCCSRGDKHVRSFVRPHAVLSILNQHIFEYKPGYVTVNADLDQVEGATSDPPKLTRMYVNHYVTKSREDFKRKFSGSPLEGHLKADNSSLEEYLDQSDNLCTDKCQVLIMPEVTYKP